MDIKKNWSLYLTIALPIAMVLFIIASIYLPKLWAPKPQYNFVYVTRDLAAGYGKYNLYVLNGKLVKEEIVNTDIQGEMFDKTKSIQYSEPHIYLYNVATNENKSITFEEAQKLSLDDRKTSQDGFEVLNGGGYGGPFGPGNPPALYLTGHSTSKKLDLRGISNVYDFEFIGWVE